MYFQNHTSISQLYWDMMYLCGNNLRYPIVYRAGFFVLFYLATLNLINMSALVVKFNFCVKTNVLLCSGSKKQLQKLNVWYQGVYQPSKIQFFGTWLTTQGGLKKDLKIPLFKAYLWSIRIKSLVDYLKSKLKLEMLVGELLKNVPNSALQVILFKWAFFMNHEWKYKNYCLTVTRDDEGGLLM